MSDAPQTGGDPFAPLPPPGLKIDLGRLKPAPEIWEVVIPAPEPVPTPALIKHYTHGTAARVWTYPDANGQTLYAVARFEKPNPEGGKPDKEYLPYSYGRRQWTTPGGKRCNVLGWHFKRPCLPAPLFGLDALAAMQEAPALVCEGEKSTSAAAQILPAMACITSLGGCKAPHNADWSALAGRRVTIWPDHDAAGATYALAVADLAKAAGAASVSIVQIPRDWPEGWDLADDLPAGATMDTVAAMIAGAVPYDDGAADERLTEDASSDPGEKSQEAASVEKDDPVAAVVAEFNALYMMVNEQGKAVILQPGYDPVLKRRTYDRLAVRDLVTLYMNRQVKVGEKEDGTAILKSAADVWLRHRDRRQYIHGVTFDPTTTQAKPGVLNLWQGFAIKPKAGKWENMRWHIEHVLCGGVQEQNNYCINWMARMVQRPAEQGETAIVLKGVEGCGKGFVARALGRIAGQHGIAISNAKHLVGNFNAHLRDSVFLFADEAFFAGDRSHVGVLKALITEPHLTIEGKFQNAAAAANFLHVMMASNEDWVVPASIEARRFFVLNVLPTMVGDHAYFAALNAEMEAGGYEAMLHDLLAIDLTTFNVRSVPTTEGLQHQRKLSLGTTEAWWLDCLERGYVFKSKLGLDDLLSVWLPKVSTELLYASYQDYAKSRGERRPLSREALGEFFSSKIKAQASKLRNVIVGEALQDEANAFGGTSRKALPLTHPRRPGYFLGELHQARADFTKQFKLAVVWDDGLDDDGRPSNPPQASAADADDPFGYDLAAE